LIRRFIDWYLKSPLYKTIWFTPLVAFIGGVALIKNLITGETKINEQK